MIQDDEMNIKLLAKSFSAWDKLTEQEQKELLENITSVCYPKGANIHSGENDCRGVYVIKSGVLRVYILSESGKEITLYRMGSGDMCILSASCVLSAITFDVHIDAEEDAEVLMIGSPFFLALTQRNLHVECFTYKLAADKFSDVMWAMQQILFMSMDKRLANFLWDELSHTDGDTLHITHEQAARYMGSAREVVTRMLKYFSEEGIVELSRGGIRILDKNKLKKLTAY